MQHGARVLGLRLGGVFVHQPGQQFLIEAAPIHADADGLAVFQRDLDDLGELPVALVAKADIAGIDAVFVERLGTGRMIGQQLVADIMEVADQRNAHAPGGEPVTDMRNAGRRFIAVDRDPHEFRAGLGELCDLQRGFFDIGRVGVGHGLHNDRGIAANRDATDLDGDRLPSGRKVMLHAGLPIARPKTRILPLY